MRDTLLHYPHYYDSYARTWLPKPDPARKESARHILHLHMRRHIEQERAQDRAHAMRISEENAERMRAEDAASNLGLDALMAVPDDSPPKPKVYLYRKGQ